MSISESGYPTLEDSFLIISQLVFEMVEDVCKQFERTSLDNNPELIENPQALDINAMMEVEPKGESDSSSSVDDEEFLANHLIKMNEESEEEGVNPQEKFLTKNEKKTKPLFEDETKEQREARYGYSNCNEPKRKVGVIQSFFENTIVIKPLIREVLDLDNLVFSKDEILGKIDDVFGNVDNPFYSILAEPYIRKKFQEKVIVVMDEVFVFEAKVKVLLQSSINEIKRRQGCDASNMFDEEVTEKEMEYSDDEKECKLKNKKKKPIQEEGQIQRSLQQPKEKKFHEKQRKFMARSDHSNQIYGRNVRDFNFWGNQQNSQQDNNYGYIEGNGTNNGFGYYEGNEQMNPQQNYYQNTYQGPPANNSFFGQQNQIYHPEYYQNNNMGGYPPPQNNFNRQQQYHGYQNQNQGFFPRKKYY